MGCNPGIFCVPKSSELRVEEVIAVCDGANHLIGRVAGSDHGHWALSEGIVVLKACQVAFLAKWFQSFDDGLESFRAGCLGVNPQVERLICIGIEDTTVEKLEEGVPHSGSYALGGRPSQEFALGVLTLKHVENWVDVERLECALVSQ